MPSCVILARDIGGVVIDVVISEELTSEMEVAEHPVEKGAKISDHAWRKPRTWTVEAAVAGERAADAYQALFALQKAAEPFDIVTGFDLIPSVLITSLKPSRDKDTGSVLKFEATLTEVIIVESQEGPATTGDGAKSDERARKTANRGQVQAKDVSTSTPSGEEILRQLEGV